MHTTSGLGNLGMHMVIISLRGAHELGALRVASGGIIPRSFYLPSTTGPFESIKLEPGASTTLTHSGIYHLDFPTEGPPPEPSTEALDWWFVDELVQTAREKLK